MEPSLWQSDAERIKALETKLDAYDKKIGPILVMLDRGSYLVRVIVYLCGAVFALVGFGAAVVSIIQYVASLKK